MHDEGEPSLTLMLLLITKGTSITREDLEPRLANLSLTRRSTIMSVGL